MPRKTSPALERAKVYLQKLFDNASSNGGLPSVAHMAVDARVSYVTMWKAVDLARREGNYPIVDDIAGDTKSESTGDLRPHKQSAKLCERQPPAQSNRL